MHIAQQWSGSGPFGPDPDPERKEGRVPNYSTLYKQKTYDIFQWNALIGKKYKITDFERGNVSKMLASLDANKSSACWIKHDSGHSFSSSHCFCSCNFSKCKTKSTTSLGVHSSSLLNTLSSLLCFNRNGLDRSAFARWLSEPPTGCGRNDWRSLFINVISISSPTLICCCSRVMTLEKKAWM